MANTQLGDSQKIPYSYFLNDKDSNLVPLAAGQTVSVVSSDTASATVVPDATPAAGSTASGFILGGAKLQAGVTVTFSALDVDGTTKLVDDVVDTFDVVVGKAVTAAVTLGTPVDQ